MEKITIFFITSILLFSIFYVFTPVKADENYLVTIDPSYVSVGQTTSLTIVVTDTSSSPQNDIYVGVYGCGINQNGSTDTEGKVKFSITPQTTGTINIDVGAEGSNVSEVITVTSWVLDISVSEPAVNEGEVFTVTVIKQSDLTPVAGAIVTISEMETMTTDSNGEAKFTAPQVTSDRDYLITATADGYISDTSSIRVINVPGLIISVINEVEAGSTFEVTVASSSNGLGVVGAIIKIYDPEGHELGPYTTKASGIATITAPDTPGTYTITASFGSFKEAVETIEVYTVENIEVTVPNKNLEKNEQFTIQVTSEGEPVEDARVYIEGKTDSEVRTNSEGYAFLTAPENIGSFVVKIEGYDSDGNYITDTIDIAVGSSATDVSGTEGDSEDDIGLDIILIILAFIIFDIIIIAIIVYHKKRKKL